MRWLTTDADIRCGHGGRVRNVARQRWVSVRGAPVLVDDDPERRTISACPNYGTTVKPCTRTREVVKGYSTLVRIDGAPIVLATLDGLTNGSPPGAVHYGVVEPGQRFVAVGP